MSKQLSKEEWIDAGLKTLAGKGVEAVRIEPIARTLAVTKGSFYWHFKNRTVFLHALLEAWAVRATGEVIEDVEARGGNAEAKLRTLFAIVFNASGRLDQEIRIWAARDQWVEAALNKVDRTRLDYLKALFEELGFSPTQATARAHFAYNALIGQFAMGVRVKSDKAASEQAEIIFNMLVGKD